MSTAERAHTGHTWIESDRIVGRHVFDHDGTEIGRIRCVSIDRRSGMVGHVAVYSHGLFGIGSHEYQLPWSVLSYDTRFPGYRASVRKSEISPVLGARLMPAVDLSDY